MTALSLVASAAALRGRPALLDGSALSADFAAPDGPPLPGEAPGWHADPAAAVDAALATVPLILRRAAYVDSLMAPQRALAPVEAAWLGAARRALGTSIAVQAPWGEAGRFDATHDAAGFRITLHAGEQLRVELITDPADAPLFLDLMDAGGGEEPLAVRTGAGVLEHRAAADGTFVLRLQPPAGVAAGYTLRVTTRSALRFPIPGRGPGAILSHFLEPRAGGARRHQGVDIHAPRGHPVIAAADGVIERVEDTPLGGRVVWLRETATDRVHYYAHLDTQLVRPGARVRAGAVIGTVGTTGNAEGTAPHLHFEVQIGGESLDPAPFLYATSAPPAAAPTADPFAAAGGADPAALRSRARTRLTGAALRPSIAATARAATLPRHTEVEILAVSGRHYRVRTADGVEGFLAAWLLEPLPAPAAQLE